VCLSATVGFLPKKCQKLGGDCFIDVIGEWGLGFGINLIFGEIGFVGLEKLWGFLPGWY